MSQVPWPEALKNHYTELDLSDRKLLLIALDEFLSKVVFDVSKHQPRVYNVNRTSARIIKRVGPEALEAIMSDEPLRNGSGRDKNLINLNKRPAKPLKPIVQELLEQLVGSRDHGGLKVSGAFWYPKNGYMGWHTNLEAPGCRLYCSYAREPGRSFFRYREPETNIIRTSWDRGGWQFRLFRIARQPLWHTVYSETDRVSVGFKLTPSKAERPEKIHTPNRVRVLSISREPHQ